MRPNQMTLITATLLAVFLVGCSKKSATPPEETPTPTTTPPPTSMAQSAKGQIRFKADLRIENDFASILSLSGPVCTELGQYSCAGDVHKVALGGVDPYTGGVYEPAERTGVTSPLIVERVALSACDKRVQADFADTTAAIIFRNLPLDNSGKITNPGASEVADAVDTLARRAWLRPARNDEIAAIVGLYSDVEISGAADPAQQWAKLSCMVVLTSMETLFY